MPGRQRGRRQRRLPLPHSGSIDSGVGLSVWRALIAAVLILAITVGTNASAQVVEIKLADDADTDQRDVLLQATIEDAAGQPLELRMLRMTLQPGARSPWHAHPGLEFGLIEAGTLRVQVNGPAVLRPADAAVDAETQVVPENLDLSLAAGDRIAFAPGTEMTFENAGAEPATLLAATVFPAGNDAPSPAAFREGAPAAEESQGIQSVILGQAVVPATDAGSVVVFERLEVDAGGNVAAFPGPVLMAMEEGTIAGAVRSPAAASASAPGDSTSASSEDLQFSLNQGEAAYFSTGMSEAPLGGDGRIVLLRLGIVPPEAPPAATAQPSPAATQTTGRPVLVSTPAPAPAPTSAPTPGRTIRTITGRDTPTPEAAPVADANADAPAASEPVAATDTSGADESDAGAYPAAGTVLMVNDDDVRIRADPSVNGAILAGLSAGQLVVVLGEPVDADGYIWYPVQDAAAPELQGWVAAPFLSLAAAP